MPDDFNYQFACNALRCAFKDRLNCTVNVLTMPGAESPALWVQDSGGDFIAGVQVASFLRGAGWLVGETDGHKMPTFVKHVRDLEEAARLIARRWHAKRVLDAWKVTTPA